jgi:hypothetical protein
MGSSYQVVSNIGHPQPISCRLCLIATESLAVLNPNVHDGLMTHPDYDHLQRAAKDHLWLHFSRHSVYDHADVPVIVRGEGPYIWDAKGKRYLDGLAGLFVSQLGHGRTELAEAAAKQARELAFMPLWSYAHPGAIELAERVADYAPGDLNRVFFTSGGGEAVETAWKLAKNYFKLKLGSRLPGCRRGSCRLRPPSSHR